MNLTHVGLIEQHAPTGEYVDDDETVPQRAWQPVAEGPCRYEPEGQPFVREEMGGRVYKEARTHWQPWTVGEADGGAYECTVGAGDNWRLTLEGIDGVFAIAAAPKVHSSGAGAPSHVTIEVERVDASDLGGDQQ